MGHLQIGSIWRAPEKKKKKNTQAQQDVEVWAHELTHVIQYEQLGIETFAFEYSYDFTDLENQARDNASRTMASIAAVEN